MSVREVMERGGPRKLLARDGGGIRGLIAVEVLAEIERQLRRDRRGQFRLAKEFDYIAGTSTGAIIAASTVASTCTADGRCRSPPGGAYDRNRRQQDSV